MMDPEFYDEDAENPEDSYRKISHDPGVTSISVRFDGFLNINKMQQLIRTIQNDLGANLYRYKGVLNVAGVSMKYVFQGVGMLYSGKFSGDWKDTDKRECRFVFIGKNIDAEGLNDSFLACKCSEKVRAFCEESPQMLLFLTYSTYISSCSSASTWETRSRRRSRARPRTKMVLGSMGRFSSSGSGATRTESSSTTRNPPMSTVLWTRMIT